jgi:tetratricopeptide (TPR) repeat protein
MSALASPAETLRNAHALICCGDYASAAVLLGTIAPDHPAHPHALHLHGIIHAVQGRTVEASRLFEQAHQQLPDNEDLVANLARAYAATQRFADALALLDRLISSGAASAATYSDRSALLERLGQPELALASYTAALALDPQMSAAWSGKGNLLHEKQRYPEALRCHDKAVETQPQNAQAWSNRASTLDKLGRMEEALIDNERALALQPANAVAWSGRGVSLVLLDRLEEGLASFDQALQIDPSNLRARINRAAALAELCRYAESLQEFDLALQRAPSPGKDHAHAQTFRGMLQLAMGDAAGWSGYEYRLYNDEDQALHDAQAPRWTGAEALAGKRILLWSEQGYGDTIQFCRYAASLVERGATVMLEVPASLVTLCAQLPAHSVYAKGATLPEHDFQIPMMSMPLALHQQGRDGTVPYATGYLHAPSESADKWKQQLPPRRHRQRIGVVCSGALHHQRNARRSVPLAVLLPLAEIADLVILQPELNAEDTCALENSPDVFRPSIDTADFADVAGLIANVDLVISVDTAIAHLAGAMAKPTWILLPWHAEWRWMTGRGDTPWYASARLFRQPARNDWDAVMQKVRLALSE